MSTDEGNTMTTIDLTAASDYQREHYGVLLESVTQHSVTGKGVHNRSHPHTVDVWANRLEFADGRAECYLDPRGRATEAPYSFLLKAQAVVISINKIDRPAQGDTLAIGDIVRLTVHGFSIGWFQIMALPLHDPHLVPVDVSTSASRQHYIDTGEYLERDLEI